MTYDESRGECDKCNDKINDGDEVYCQECIDRMQAEIEELRETVEKLQEENTALDESVSASTQIIEKLQGEVV